MTVQRKVKTVQCSLPIDPPHTHDGEEESLSTTLKNVNRHDEEGESLPATLKNAN